MRKIDRLMAFGFLPAFLALSGVVTVILKLFGEEYGINWTYVFGFSLMAMLNTVVSINGIFAQVHSRKILARVLFWHNTLNFTLMLAYIPLVWLGYFSISAVLLIMTLSYAFAFFIYKYIFIQEGLYADKS